MRDYFAQSAGAGSVEAHVLFPPRRKLFRAAMADSSTGPLFVFHFVSVGKYLTNAKQERPATKYIRQTWEALHPPACRYRLRYSGRRSLFTASPLRGER